MASFFSLVSLLLGSQASVSFFCWVLLFSLLFIAAVRVMASSGEMILILVIVMEGEDAIVVAAAGGGLSFWHMRDINTYILYDSGCEK